MPKLYPSPSRVPGNLTIGGDITLTGGGQIVGDGTIRLLPTGAYYTEIGDATAAGNLGTPTNDDCHICGRLEVDGTFYADAGAMLAGNNYFRSGGSGFTQIDAGSDASVYGAWRIKADDGWHLCTGIDGYGNNTLVLTSYTNNNKTHGASAHETNPTLKIFSAVNPEAGDSTQWSSFATDSTTGRAVQKTGKGNHAILPKTGRLEIDDSDFDKGVSYIQAYHSTITLSTVSATTNTGITPNGQVLGVAFRVSTEIAGLSDDDHDLQVGIGGSEDRYAFATFSGTSCPVNTKSYYGNTPVYESAQIIITIATGADNIPSAGAVELLVLVAAVENLPSV